MNRIEKKAVTKNATASLINSLNYAFALIKFKAAPALNHSIWPSL